MITPVFIILAIVVYSAVHSFLASLWVKTWARQRLGSRVNRWYRLIYNLFAVISALPILGLLLTLPDQTIYQIPFPWVLLTSVGQLAGILIIIVGILQTDLWHFIGLRQIIDPKSSASTEMVTTGLYRWVRHPLYMGGLLLIWLTPVMTVNLLTIFIQLTVYLIVGAKLEEQRLIQEFGEAYREYQQRVPRLLPTTKRKP